MGTCMTVGSEVVHMESMSTPIVMCFKVLDKILTKNESYFLKFIMKCTYLYTIRYFYTPNII